MIIILIKILIIIHINNKIILIYRTILKIMIIIITLFTKSNNKCKNIHLIDSHSSHQLKHRLIKYSNELQDKDFLNKFQIMQMNLNLTQILQKDNNLVGEVMALLKIKDINNKTHNNSIMIFSSEQIGLNNNHSLNLLKNKKLHLPLLKFFNLKYKNSKILVKISIVIKII